jgi:glutathione synthase/RimK-type ligase-like ATP-grasp enzyme
MSSRDMPTSGRPVLILTQEFDLTVDPVVRVLTERTVPVVRLDLSAFPRAMTLTSSDFGAERQVLRHGGRTVDLARLAAVWLRRPTEFDFGDEMDEAARHFARNEAILGVGGVLRATDCLWVNRPDVDSVAELKPYQLAAARKVGLRTPRTLLTNDPAEVAALRERVSGPLVYKALSGGVFRRPGGFPVGLLTTVVGDELAAHLARVRHTICMFQEYVEKAYEVRLTVIGNTYFPVTIRSQETGATRVDWRGRNDMPYGDYVPLPAQVVKQVQALLAELGVVYAAVDLIVTPAGEYVFLEANPNGQFIWMETDLGLPLAERMADLLATGGPFRRGEATQVGY